MEAGYSRFGEGDREPFPDRLDRPDTLPLRVAALVRQWRPDGVLGWMPKGAKLVPANPAPFRLVRLGDYPTSLAKFRNIDVVVCNTPGIARHVKEMGWTRGVEVISNFTSLERAAPVSRDALDTPQDAFVISSMGRFVPRKGFDVLIRSVAKLPGVYLWLVGAGGEEANLRALAEQTRRRRPRPLRRLAEGSPPVHRGERRFCDGVEPRAAWQRHPGGLGAEGACRFHPVGRSDMVHAGWPVTDSGRDRRSHGFADAISRIRGDAGLAKALVAGFGADA